jgi:hypothetical protein
MVWKENLCEKLWDLGWFVQNEIFIDIKSASSGPLCHWAKWIKPPVRSPIPILIPLEVGLWKNHLILKDNNHAKFNIFCSFRFKKLWNDKCAYHLTKSFLAISKVEWGPWNVLTTLSRAFSNGNQSGVRRGPQVGEGYDMITSKQTRGVTPWLCHLQ